MDTASIYKLVDPRDLQPRYVGRTTQALEKRLGDHLALPTNPLAEQWFSELRAAGLRPIIELIELVDWSQADAREEFWIVELAKSFDLLNRRIPRPPMRSLTVRIPPAIMQEVRSVAQESGICVNDAMIALIRAGAAALLEAARP